ncbi:hypothetical protein AX774_g2279 [Zancudomyces culisetae]|uniref:Uncharacterized protein n=1 Tax=Zancudomyces culisetae TaxID=1213189 RepID=A0A1R1PTI8_ZANCU|nr:hypothetical protein AX774_g4340 [Zancudomyces culisetae]OMH84202.1 hypothetical protein AX774_g2279 [Zancudomyces culisetae]|eukprot:OMH82181.1 hypothetical protein AX774_g4340 [Zancudomyces culisetae]
MLQVLPYKRFNFLCCPVTLTPNRSYSYSQPFPTTYVSFHTHFILSDPLFLNRAFDRPLYCTSCSSASHNSTSSCRLLMFARRRLSSRPPLSSTPPTGGDPRSPPGPPLLRPVSFMPLLYTRLCSSSHSFSSSPTRCCHTSYCSLNFFCSSFSFVSRSSCFCCRCFISSPSISLCRCICSSQNHHSCGSLKLPGTNLLSVSKKSRAILPLTCAARL